MAPKSIALPEQELRRIVREEILREDEGGGDYGGFGGDGGWGAMGMHDPWPGSLYQTFVQPFVDVGKTAKAALEDATSRARRVAETAIQAVPAMLLPFVAGEYDKLKRAERQRYEAIQRKYADVFRRTEDALQGDAQGVAFMLAPAHYLATTLVKTAAKPMSKAAASSVLDLIDTLTSRADPVVKLTSAARAELGLEEGAHAAGLAEAQPDARDQDRPQQPNRVVAAVARHPDVKAALKDSGVAAEMGEDARSIVSGTLMGLIRLSDKLAAVQTLADLSRLTGKSVVPEGLADLPEDEQRAAAQAVLSQAKRGMLGVIGQQLKREIEGLLQQGIDPDHPLVLAFKRALGKIAAR